MKKKSWPQNRFLWVYFIIAFGFTWLFLVPLSLSLAGLFSLSPPSLVGGIMGFGPFFAAHLLVYMEKERAGIMELWMQAFGFRMRKIWYLPIFLLLPALNVAALLLNIISGASIPELELFAKPWLIPFDFFSAFFLKGSVQEFGWRGYALSRLQARWGPLASSIVLGTVNALWLAPLFFIRGLSFGWTFFVSPVVLAVCFTWLHNNTRGNIMTALLFHAMASYSVELFRTRETIFGELYYFILMLAVATILASVWELEEHYPEGWRSMKSLLHGSWEWLLAALCFWTLYLPVIAGILFPMIFLFGVVLFFYLSWWSWAKIFPEAWVFATSNICIQGWDNFVVVGFVLLILGVTIFTLGLIQILRARVNNEGLVVSGLYSVVRHPQHVGIAIATLGILFLNRIGPRPGDIIAWTLLTFLFILLADREEAELSRMFGNEYQAYCSKVPFMIPFFPRIESAWVRRLSERVPKGSWKRRFLFTAIYFVFLEVLILYLKTLAMTPMPLFRYS